VLVWGGGVGDFKNGGSLRGLSEFFTKINNKKKEKINRLMLS
jgi:hypothetical protein